MILCSLNVFGQTQSDLNRDAENSYEAADKELNNVYKKTLTEYAPDTLFIKNLKISQRLWIEFRDAEMAMKYPAYGASHYGSASAMCWLIYEEQLTRERIKTLMQWLDGIEEGDVCHGSVKIKSSAQ